MRSAGGSEAIAASSDPDSRELAELEFGLGEGPSLDAYANAQPVLVADLADQFQGRWSGYTPAAVKAGLFGVYAFPLVLGAAKFGVLTVFSSAPHHLAREERSRCLVLAEMATQVLLDSSDSSVGGAIDPHLESALDFRSEIYQAQGMVMVSLRLRLPEALADARVRVLRGT